MVWAMTARDRGKLATTGRAASPALWSLASLSGSLFVGVSGAARLPTICCSNKDALLVLEIGR
jgi:hypothetical protein